MDEDELIQEVHIDPKEFSGLFTDGSSGGVRGFLGGMASNLLKGRGGGIGDAIGGLIGGGGGQSIDLRQLIGGLFRDRFRDKIARLAANYLNIDPETGKVIGAIAGNLVFDLGGKDNVLGDFGKRLLDRTLGGKWRRKVRPFVKPEPSPVEPVPAEPQGGQDFESLRQECLDTEALFEDPEFPAEDISLSYSGNVPYGVEWKRPGEICEEPMLFVEGSSRFDVKQGALGNCWMLAASAALTLKEELFYRVVPPNQSFTDNYAGIFHFQFWQYGDWVDVVVDDRLPTKDGELLYSFSEESNEFWSALLEKAYAKLNGSYEALVGGTTTEALEDFTGGLTELVNLKDSPPPNLLQMVFKAFEKGSLLGASIQGEPGQLREGILSTGLATGHAYSITGMKLVEGPDGQTPLVRIRNPWGSKTEWNGAWSDGSPEWESINDEEKEAIGLVFDHDGEFWMAWDDLQRNFDSIEMCHLGPEVFDEVEDMLGIRPEHASEWHNDVHHSTWSNDDNTAGGCRNYIDTFAYNPQIMIELSEPDPSDEDGLCLCIFAVLQKYRRQLRSEGMDNLPAGFAVYQVDETPSDKLPTEFFETTRAVGRSPVFVNLREVMGRCRLPPGIFVIVPSTFEPGQEAQFMLRMFSDIASSSQEL